MTASDLFDKVAQDMQEPENQKLMDRAISSAEEMIEDRYPKVIASEFVVELKVGFRSAMIPNVIIDRFVVRRQNRLERRLMNNKVISSKGKFSELDMVDEKINKLIVKMYSSDPESGGIEAEWTNIPPSVRQEILNNLDMIDEDEIIESMAALENGYGDLLSFYSSNVYRQLKAASDKTFQGDSGEI